MHVQRLKVKNFRALEDIDVDFTSPVSVVIGPNAAGKTTILEAIRLAKAVLAPRTQQETNQALISLGTMSPHLPQRLFPEAVACDPSRPTSIKCDFKVHELELDVLRKALPRIPAQLAQSSSGIIFSSQNQIASFFASESGKLALKEAEAEVKSNFSELEVRKIIRVHLNMDWSTGIIGGEYPVDQMFFSVIEQLMDPSKTTFSYFPADRSMPAGEQPVQLGIADTSAQLESYNSQPQTKFIRLKHTIFSSIVQNEQGRKVIEEDFKLIFERILRGRSLSNIGINEVGLLSIRIKDNESGRTFDIDALSSGEKGLILTFLLIGRSMADGGVVLLDEPELHLNPAVSRDVLQFLIEEFVTKRNIQAIICSHSAEILTAALEDPSCQLYHLRGGKSLARVRQHDQGEIRDALSRLGSSESESLLYRGTVSVEGIHDAEILRVGFDDLFRRFKFRERGGRGEIERSIKELQKAEKSDSEIGFHFFLFDHDRHPTDLSSSDHVRLLQWDRTCLENYLLDVDIITDLTREAEFSDRPMKNTSDMLLEMKRLAREQLSEVAARITFRELGLQSVAFDMNVLRSENSAAAMAGKLIQRIEQIEELFGSLRVCNFGEKFVERFGSEFLGLEPVWDDRWREVCDGKRLLEQLRRDGLIKGDLLRFKRRVASEMRAAKTEVWRTLESKLKEFITINI